MTLLPFIRNLQSHICWVRGQLPSLLETLTSHCVISSFGFIDTLFYFSIHTIRHGFFSLITTSILWGFFLFVFFCLRKSNVEAFNKSSTSGFDGLCQSPTLRCFRVLWNGEKSCGFEQCLGRSVSALIQQTSSDVYRLHSSVLPRSQPIRCSTPHKVAKVFRFRAKVKVQILV